MPRHSVPTSATILLDDYLINDRDRKGDGIAGKEFIQALDRVGRVDSLKILINSGGGDCAAMQAILDVIEQHPAKEITTECTELAGSAACVIFCAGRKRVMRRGARLMMHNARSPHFGETVESRKWSARIRDFMSARTGVHTLRLKEWMDAERYFSANEALGIGLATAIDGGTTRLQELAQEIDELKIAREIAEETQFRMRINRALERSRDEQPAAAPIRKAGPIPVPVIPARLRGKLFITTQDYREAGISIPTFYPTT